MASKEQLRKVALYCDEYTPIDKSSFNFSSSSSSEEEYNSCENCQHFTKEHKCDINLVDKVLSSMAMELDKK